MDINDMEARKKATQEHIDKLSKGTEKTTLAVWLKKWMANSKANKERLKSLPRFSRDFLSNQIHKGRPAIVVGAGPSLENNIERLKTVDREKCIVIATDRAFRQICQHGIKPHYVVSLDAWDELFKFLQGYEWIRRTKWSETNITTDHTGITLICTVHSHPTLFDAWKGNFLVITPAFIQPGENPPAEWRREQYELMELKPQGNMSIDKFIELEDYNISLIQKNKLIEREHIGKKYGISSSYIDNMPESEYENLKSTCINEIQYHKPKSFTGIAKYPAIATMGNAGTCGTVMAELFGCNPIALMGMDCSEDETSVTIPFQYVDMLRAGQKTDGKIQWNICREPGKITQQDEPTPGIKTFFGMDDIWDKSYLFLPVEKYRKRYVSPQFFESAMTLGKKTAAMSGKFEYINCTEGGICYHENLKGMSIRDFIDWYRIGSETIPIIEEPKIMVTENGNTMQ